MKIAVVGGGISGMASALILGQQHEVHLFESDSRMGGHAHTVTLSDEDGSPVMDTGFLVYNNITYPHFIGLLNYLDVETVDSDMSLSIQSAKDLEWAGTNLKTVFAQKRNLLNFRFLNMLKDIIKFHNDTLENLELSKQNKWTLSDLITFRKMSTAFQSWYLLPMTGAIWSMSYAKALQFPAETFLNFCINHHLLQVNDRPIWRTINKGSIQYVSKLTHKLQNIHLNSPIQSIRQQGEKLVLSSNGNEFEFDRVVLATHAPISKKILEPHFSNLADKLSSLKTTSNRVVLHSDMSVMPQKKICWSSWNVKAQENPDNQSDIQLTYYLNKLQPLGSKKDYFITLNNEQTLKGIKREFIYDHPQFDQNAISFQETLPSIQGQNGIYFAGAWTRYGFHEDGILSAVKVSKLLGVNPPWENR